MGWCKSYFPKEHTFFLTPTKWLRSVLFAVKVMSLSDPLTLKNKWAIFPKFFYNLEVWFLIDVILKKILQKNLYEIFLKGTPLALSIIS